MDSGFGNNVGVKAVAEINGVDVIALQVRVPIRPIQRSNIGQPENNRKRRRNTVDEITNIIVKKT